jgi:hypothetical protein
LFPSRSVGLDLIDDFHELDWRHNVEAKVRGKTPEVVITCDQMGCVAGLRVRDQVIVFPIPADSRDDTGRNAHMFARKAQRGEKGIYLEWRNPAGEEGLPGRILQDLVDRRTTEQDGEHACEPRMHDLRRWRMTFWIQQETDIEICVEIGSDIHLGLVALKDKLALSRQVVNDFPAESLG